MDSTLQDSTDSNHNFTNEGYVFHILSDFVSDESRLKLKNLKDSLCLIYPCEICIHILSDEEFRDSPKWGGHKNHLTYFRIKMASVLPQEICKCLYLDIDMLVLGDVRELFAIDLKDKILGVVLDCSNPYVPKILKAREETKEDFVFPYRKEYFNAGFMLINLEQWRFEKVEQKCLEFMRTYITRVGDQDIINAVVGNRTIKLSPKWNFFALHFTAGRLGRADNFCADEGQKCLFGYTKKEYEEALKGIKILHYTFSCAKPWQNYHILIDKDYLPLEYPYYQAWWEMALQTPIYREELIELQEKLKDNALKDYSIALAKKLKARDEITEKKLVEVTNKNKEQFIKISQLCDEENRNKNFLETLKTQQIQETLDSLGQEIKNTKKVYGAKERIQNHLSFKIGKALLESKGFWSRIWLPFLLYQIRKQHNKSLEIYTQICRVNPTLKLLPLESYSDYKGALEEKESKAYKLGVEFMKAYKGREIGKLFRMLFVNN